MNTLSTDRPFPEVRTNSADQVSGLYPALAAAASRDLTTDTLELLEETMTVSKRQVLTGRVRVTTRTETRDEMAK